MRAAESLLSLALTFALASGACVGASGCSSQSGDPPSNDGVPPPGGKDLRIAQVVNPALPGHHGLVNTTQSVSGAIVIAVDAYDETNDGKNIGDVLIQDLAATKDTPYAGIGLFATTFNPGNLKVSAGDVLDLTGQYQESAGFTATTQFPPGAVLAQLYQPTATFRYETNIPEPVDIDAGDLLDFAKGQRWIGMLVRVKGLTAAADIFASTSGRQSVDTAVIQGAGTKCESPFPKPGQIVNNLMDLTPTGIKQGTVIKSLVGVVGFFCSMQIAPRSAADIQL